MATYKYLAVKTRNGTISELFRRSGSKYEALNYATGEWEPSKDAMDAFHGHGEYAYGTWTVSEEDAIAEEKFAKE